MSQSDLARAADGAFTDVLSALEWLGEARRNADDYNGLAPLQMRLGHASRLLRQAADAIDPRPSSTQRPPFIASAPIAAAPDLLTALEDMTRIARAASYANGVTGNTKRIEAADAAISKAEGIASAKGITP